MAPLASTSHVHVLDMQLVRTSKVKKYEVGVASGRIMFIPNSVILDQLVQKLKEGNTHTNNMVI